MIVVTGTFRFPAGARDKVFAAMSTVEAATRKEDGCIVYAFYADRNDEERFRVYEEWESWDALHAHGRSAHISAFREALGKLGILERNVKAFEVGEGKQL